ncbi:MAG: ABC transporter permease [Candidatus Pacebacteria bacterium]|nr:ABC transporter permease [Candidatus Paceibacterota bacterium]
MKFAISPLSQRRLTIFKSNRRGFYSFFIFIFIFVASLFAEVITNDRPIIINYNGQYYFPIVKSYSETTFGGELNSFADYRDPYLVDRINSHGWAIWPPLHFGLSTVATSRAEANPAPPNRQNILGTDDQGRDVFAQLIYGFRYSILFGLCLTILSSIIGISAGAIQGYFGGIIDISLQRFIEVWSGMPQLFLLIILASIVDPNFWWLLGLLLLFSWIDLVAVVRAEFLRARNLEFVRAATALGVPNRLIVFRHILPNAIISSLTFLPFILNSSLVLLVSLDFLGFGLPPGSPSLGAILAQAKRNLQAPWLSLTIFVFLSILLCLLIFIGEAVRDAFNPRKVYTGS